MPSADSVLRGAKLVSPDTITIGPLFVANGRIACEATPGAHELDLAGHLIFPGLINAHDHLHLNNVPPAPQQTFFANSYEWIRAFEPYFADPAVARAVAVPKSLRHWQGGLKNLLCGATTVAHHDPWHPIFDEPAFPTRLLRHFGWAHSLGLGLADSQPSYGPRVIESFAATASDQPWIIHLAEGTDEIAAAELAQLDALGCLAANSVLVHGVGLTSKDVDRVIERGAAVVWCPASNLHMLGQTLNPRRLFDAGRLALGTDSRLTGSHDLLAELRCAAASSDLRPAELLQLATIAASRILSLPDVGTLALGSRADLLILRDSGNPYEALLDARRGDIRAVVRDGLPRLADLDFADWFAACGMETTQIELDGRPKLIASALLAPEGAAAIEPGLYQSTDDTDCRGGSRTAHNADHCVHCAAIQ